jgi:hypothetical protein
VTAQSSLEIEPEAILDDLLGLDPALMRQGYYGERSVFYNPGAAAPLGVIFASIKDRDGPDDKRANLSRPGVYRFAFQLGEPDTDGGSGRCRDALRRPASSTSQGTT